MTKRNGLAHDIIYMNSAIMKTIDGHHIALGNSNIYAGDDLKTKTPNLRMMVGDVEIHLTWDEMRKLAEAMIAYCDVAEFG